jgi:hypothetical protein
LASVLTARGFNAAVRSRATDDSGICSSPPPFSVC